jgi:cytochrome c553
MASSMSRWRGWGRVLVVVLAFGVSTAPARADGQAGAGVEFFEKRVRPLLVKHCYECHGPDAKKVRGELRLDTREGVLQGGASGPTVVPGKPDQSLLIQAVRHVRKDLRMPPKGKLSAAEIADLEAWVAMGAPDPRTGKGATKPWAATLEEGRKFWAFQPVKAVAPPAVKNAAWPLTPVDRFILAGLEAKGLTPVPPADRRTLIRRVTFDLTGLPPTPEEIDAFLKDATPEAFARVVDRLLASPAYGERWGRHWLDVVRYADTAGDNSDYPIPQMYRYRNWVIDAFNADMPYDRFVREQLAGDLMPAASEQGRQRKLIATGYLANSRRHGSYEDARYPWHLTIEDTLDNFGKAFLGLTLGCARCHDHKFDPLSAEDYYGLYGFFSSTRYPWPGIELDRVQRDLIPLAPPEVVEKETKARQQKLAELDAAIKKLEGDKAGQAYMDAKKERDLFAKQPLPFEVVYAVTDGRNEPKKRIGQVGDVRLQIKGEPDLAGKMVRRGFPAILGGQKLAPEVKGSGRLELAGWLTDPANPLTARVMVNRIWQHHFGQGLVATPNNFGKQGRPPTHPALLDYLARQFMDNGWSVKAVHRQILLSRVYQLASDDHEGNLKIDAANDSLWRHPRRRLDAEAIRDALLAVSGNLDRTPGGPHPFPEQVKWDFTQHKPFKAVYASNRRSVYLMTQRIQRHPFLGLFDGADTNASTAERPTSTTPLQALFLMNDPFVHEQARKFAARLLAEAPDDDGRVGRGFVLAFGRPPTAEEREQARHFLAQVGDRLQAAGVPADRRPARAWESFARVLFLSNEFVYVQ